MSYLHGRRTQRGKGIGSLVNRFIANSPFELHLVDPVVGKYQYCGPGTRFKEREARGERGKNSLDNACYAHDKAYNEYPVGNDRAIADKKLLEQAESITSDPNAGFWEKSLAKTVVIPAMKFQMRNNTINY